MKGQENKNAKGFELMKVLEVQLEDIWGEETEPEIGWPKQFSQVGKCYHQRDVCISQDCAMWDDDVTCGVRTMFYQYYRAIAATIEEELGIGLADGKKVHDLIRVAVMPYYEDSSSIVVYLSSAKAVLLQEDIKAWHHGWENPDEMAEDYQEAYEAILARAKEVIAPSVHVVVTQYQGVIESVNVFSDRDSADKYADKQRDELEIVKDHEEESENQLEVYYDQEVRKGA
jgi:hypothetical protein